MLYGVEQSTDLRDRRTVIKKFTSLSNLRKWMKNGGDFTHEDPEAARNYHHDLRYGYEIKGCVNKKDNIFKDKGSPTYPLTDKDKLAIYLRKYGTEII